LASSRDGEARQRDLHDEVWVSGMGIAVIAWRASDNADVRFGLGPVVETDRALNLNEPALSEGALQRPCHEHHRGAVRALLRLLNEQQSIKQLEGVALVENAAIDQLGVLPPGPAIQRGPLALLHARMLSAAFGTVNVAVPILPRRARAARRLRRADPPAA